MSEQNTLIALTGKQKKPNPYPDKAACANLINDIDALLNGGGKEVNNPKDYKNEKGEPLLPNGTAAIKSSIDSRIADLKSDKHDLYNNHRETKNAHPEHGSYDGHKKFVENQQEALQMALTKFKTQCEQKGYKLTQKEQELIAAAEDAVKIPIPQEPAPKSSTNENKIVRTIIDSIPGIPQDQKNNIQKTIERSIQGGKNYWDNYGRQQLTDALDNLVKAGTIAVGVAAAIVTGVGEALTGGWLKGEGTTEPTNSTTVDTAINDNNNPLESANRSPNLKILADTNTTASAVPQNSSPITQPDTITDCNGSIPKSERSPNSTTDKQDAAFIINLTDKQDTAFVISTGTATTNNRNTAFFIDLTDKQNTALTGSMPLTGGQSQKPQIQQPELTPS